MYQYYKKYIKNSYSGKYLHFFLSAIHKIFLSQLSDRKHAEYMFKFNKPFSYRLNLDHPESLNEKIHVYLEAKKFHTFTWTRLVGTTGNATEKIPENY